MARQTKRGASNNGLWWVYGFAPGVTIGALVCTIIAVVIIRNERRGWEAYQFSITPLVAMLTDAPTAGVIIVTATGLLETPTQSASATPAPTATETPLPTATPIPTNTPLPTITAAPPTITPAPEPMRFSGTGDEVFDPMPLADGLYRVTFRGNNESSGGARMEEVSGDCGFYASIVTGREPISENTVRVRNCTMVLSISLSGPWEILFEKLG